MEAIYTKLEELGLKDENLPSEIMKEIDGLDEMVNALNTKISHLEDEGFSQDEIDAETQEEDQSIDVMEAKIIHDIDEWHENIYKKGGAVTNEKKSGWGWAVFGGLALILTLGAVNVMGKK
jgi:hypothetical protein